MTSASEYFFLQTNVSEEYETLVTKITVSKRLSTTKSNALRAYLSKWNAKPLDEVFPLERQMVLSRVEADIDAIKRNMTVISSYYD